MTFFQPMTPFEHPASFFMNELLFYYLFLNLTYKMLACPVILQWHPADRHPNR